jgi:glycine cleavage system aminomethyltransferase T
VYSIFQYDAVLAGGRAVGVSTWNSYTPNMKGFASLAMVDESVAKDGTEVSVLWGEPERTRRPGSERHRQVEIRATVRTTAPLGAAINAR